MIIDNFEEIIKHLSFNTADEFYLVEVFVRNKDIKHSNKKIDFSNYYTIKSVEHLLEKKEEIIYLCKLFNARAYLHPSKRSFEHIAKELVVNTSIKYTQKQYNLKSLYRSTCSKNFIKEDKKILIDVDDKRDLVTILNLIIQLKIANNVENTVLYTIPTVQGNHIISNPFNLNSFKEIIKDVSIKLNSPTLLYYGNNT